MTPEEKQKITPDELYEQDLAIDSFQMFSRQSLDTDVLTMDGFMKALARYLNAMPEESECWACKNSGVVYADHEPQDCPVCAMPEESNNQIAKQKILRHAGEAITDSGEFDFLHFALVINAMPEESNNQIAKQKIEEYVETQCYELNPIVKLFLARLFSWLDKGGE